MELKIKDTEIPRRNKPQCAHRCCYSIYYMPLPKINTGMLQRSILQGNKKAGLHCCNSNYQRQYCMKNKREKEVHNKATHLLVQTQLIHERRSL